MSFNWLETCDYHLDSIEVQNFRKFKSYRVTFEKGLTVLVGDNAAGKSTLLDAAAIAASTLLTKIENASSRKISQSDVRTVTTRQGSSFDRQSQYPSRVSASGCLAGDRLSWSRSLNTAKSSMTSIDARSVIEIGASLQEKVSRGDSETILPLIAYYGTGRLWSSSAKSLLSDVNALSSSRTKGFIGSVSNSVNERDMYTWFRKMTLWELQNRKMSPELAAVKQAIAGCLTGVRGKGDSSIEFNLETQELFLCIGNDGNGYEFESLHSLSDGYRSTLSLVADIAYRIATLNPALEERVLETPGIVMIDEIDLHLHPLWQARILGDLRKTFPRVQFIVTTHAPVVVSSVGRNHLRILDADGAFAPGEETFGRDANAVLRIMGAASRPVLIAEQFSTFYDQLDAERYSDARATLDGIEELIGGDDAELVAARTALSLEWEQ